MSSGKAKIRLRAYTAVALLCSHIEYWIQQSEAALEILVTSLRTASDEHKWQARKLLDAMNAWKDAKEDDAGET